MSLINRPARFWTMLALIAAVAVPATTFAQEQPTNPRTPNAPADRAASRTPDNRTPAKPVTAQSFASQAAIIGKAEIELGQIALRNSKDESVKNYAQRMIQDHTAADKKLQSIAATENIPLPSKLDPEHEATKMKLKGMTGEQFDKEYAKAMVDGHGKAVALFESASQQPQMPSALKEFAASTLSTLEKHEDLAHTLHDKEGA